MKLIKNILRKFGIAFHRAFVCRKDLLGEIPHIEPAIAVIISQATPADLSSIQKKLFSDPVHAGYFEKYLKSNSICLVAKHNGEIIGYVWNSNRNMRFASHIIRELKPGYMLSFAGYVFKEYRGQKVFEALIEAQYRMARDQGYRYFINFVTVGNVPAIKAREKFGVSVKRINLILLPCGRSLVFGKLE